MDASFTYVYQQVRDGRRGVYLLDASWWGGKCQRGGGSNLFLLFCFPRSLSPLTFRFCVAQGAQVFVRSLEIRGVGVFFVACLALLGLVLFRVCVSFVPLIRQCQELPNVSLYRCLYGSCACVFICGAKRCLRSFSGGILQCDRMFDISLRVHRYFLLFPSRSFSKWGRGVLG